MGLSSEERAEKIYFSVWRMTKQENIELLQADHKELADLLEKLWPAFLSAKSNGLYWVLGSGVDDESMERPGLFNVAIIGNKSRGTPDVFDQFKKEREKEIEAMPDSPEKKALEEGRWRHEYQVRYHPTFESILRRNVPALAAVYRIYEDCEHIRYALNRYRDQFAKAGAELDTLVCNILGRCFDYFTSDSQFREAWYTFQIANRVMYERVDSDSTIVKFWVKANLHHYVGIGVHALDELHDYWAKIQQKQTLSTEEAVLATLWLQERRFHYPHQYEELQKLLKEHNKSHPKDKVDLSKVERMFRIYNTPAYEKHGERESRATAYCRLSQQTVARNWKQPKPKKKGKKK